MQQKRILRNVPGICILTVFFFALTSCVNTKKATYFYGTTDGVISSNTVVPESVIQKNDILSILVSSLNSAASQVFNPANVDAADLGPVIGTANASRGSNYIVASDGTIQFPVLGKIKVEGLTKVQLQDKFVSIILEKKLLVDPIVSIRFLNFRVTVLGEVSHPTVVPVVNEKISLLEALGLAGDITIYGNKETVMVVREVNQQKVIKRINLNSAELFTSPYYYLQSNDIVIVEPNKARVASSSRSAQWLPLVLSGLSFVAIVADRVIK